MNVYSDLEQLVQRAITLKMIQEEDEIYARNQIMALLKKLPSYLFGIIVGGVII